jgi:hypothetical protein
MLVVPEDCPEPGETRNLTLVTEDLGSLRVSVDGKRINTANSFVMIKPGREQLWVCCVGLMDAEEKHEPTEEFQGQMRKLVLVAMRRV